MKTPPNPNAIIAALVNIADAAHALNTSVSIADITGTTAHVKQDFLTDLAEKLALLDTLPQLADNESFTGPRRARGWLASFLVGEVALNFDDKQLAELKTALNQARSTPLLVAEFEHSMREYQDAELLRNLREMCGYVENGSDQTVAIYQDDATCDWTVRVGTDNVILKSKARRYHASSFHQAIRVAAEKEIVEDEPEPEMCAFCGMSFVSPCDAPPTGPCEQANNAFHGSDPTKPRIQITVNPEPMLTDLAAVSAAVEATKREQMNRMLIEVKEKFGVESAKRIIVSIGHSPRMMKDVPDNRVQAVIDAARDKLHPRVVITPSLPREVTVHDHFDVPMDPESEDGKDTLAKMAHYVATGELPKPTLYETLRHAGEVLGNQDPVVEPKADDQVQGQGGEFDGGGASGDWTQ